MISGINHIAISTGDMQKCLRFYCDLMGMEMVSQGPFEGTLYDNIMGLEKATGSAAMLRLGNAQLELFEFANPSPKESDPARPVCDHGITHLCFDVMDIYQEYERLKAAEVPFHCPPQDAGFAIATYGRDPDGNVFELLQIKKGANANGASRK